MTKKEKFDLLNINSTLYRTNLNRKFKERKPFKADDTRLIKSFIPGTIIEIFVKPGQVVKKGDNLLILDAMKMKNRLKCPVEGTIKRISVSKGDKVPKGMVLIELE